MYHRGEARFYAFDLLWLNGEDLRGLQLADRKEMLRGIISARSQHLLYVDHIEGKGEELFHLACERDLEGVVAKWKRGAYLSNDDRTSWLKIKNREYSQCVGREKLFEKRTGESETPALSKTRSLIGSSRRIIALEQRSSAWLSANFLNREQLQRTACRLDRLGSTDISALP